MFPQTVSPKGRQAIKEREGLRLKAYQDGAGVWTIGYGSTDGVQAGDVISEAEADRRFDEVDLPRHVDGVKLALVREPTQKQFDAMCSLAYNIGVGAFAKSTVCRTFNAGDMMAAASAFGLWCKIRDPKTKKKIDSPGLIKRRAMEKADFLDGTHVDPAPAAAAPEATTIAQSGTVQGGTVATVASVVAGAAAVVNQAQDVLMSAPWVGGIAQTVVAYYPKIAGVLALVAIAAGIYVVFRRVQDRAKGRV